MKILMMRRLISGKSLVLGLASAAWLAASLAAAQSFDPGQASEIDYPSKSDARRQQKTTIGDQTDVGDQAATTQFKTEKDSRYTPDQIDSKDQVRVRSDGTEDTGSVARQAVAPPNEFEAYVSEIADKRLRRFGSNLLVPSARDFIVPATTAVPGDYRINPGDDIELGLSGSINADKLRLRVDPDGRIFVPRIGAVRVAGVRYGDLQSVLAAQVARQYQGFQVSVSIAQLHSLTVYVTGFAQTPGSYTVNSLATLVNAVLEAGGPSAGGSFRSIQLRRNGRLVSDFDLYDFLLKGDKSGDAQLRNGDVIFIAPIGAQVAVIGSVNNEAIFEARPTDSLTDVLIYAGGVNTVGDDTRLLVLEPLNVGSGWTELSPSEAAGRVVKRASVLRVLSGIGIARPLARQPVIVTLQGEVAKPGRYYVAAGTTMAQAIALAGGLTTDAFPYGSVFTRESIKLEQRLSYDRALRDMEFQLTAEPLTSADSTSQDQAGRISAVRLLVSQLSKQKPAGRLVFQGEPGANSMPADLVLQNNDGLYVPPVPVTVGVFGSVPSPASFAYAPGATIGDYLKLAGGVQKIGAKSQIFIVRANGTLVERHRGVFSGSILNEQALPGDLIYVPINGSRGSFLKVLRDATQLVLAGALSAATVVAVTK